MNSLEIIKKLSHEELEFYQKLLSFFSMLGVNEEELFKLIDIIKNHDSNTIAINRAEERITDLENRMRGRIVIKNDKYGDVF